MQWNARMDIAQIPGTDESALSEGEQVLLPASAPDAPWRVHARAVMWTRKPSPEAVATLRDVLPSSIIRNATPVRTIGAMVTYLDTPVGPYHEVLGIVILRRGKRTFAHVPFISVDSPASVVGGRTNWSLPKTLATFDGDPSSDRMTASADGWEVDAQIAPKTLALPWVMPPLSSVVQATPDGGLWSVRMRGRGWARVARVTATVRASAATQSWFAAGDGPGIVVNRVVATVPKPKRTKP
jgi:Acetoacetate decarboxylase (ADC)